MQIELARTGDYDEAGRVTALAFAEFARSGDPSWDAYVSRVQNVAERAARVPVFVARDGDRIVGSVTVEIDERRVGDDPAFPRNSVNLRMLGVDPHARRRGVGRALVEAVLGFGRDHDKSAVVLHVVEERVASRALYESMGFERDATRDHVDETSGLRLVAYRLGL